jgi:hypothetical protein
VEKQENKENVFKLLTDANDVRIEEEVVRPRVEMWVDEDAAWVASHRAKKRGIDFTHFGTGYH